MERKYVYGVDTGGTTVKIGRFGMEGILEERFEIISRKEDGGVRILPDIAERIQEDMRENAIGFCDLLGIGIGVPGAVLENGIVNRCVNLGWGIVHLEEELSRLMGNVHVKAANDANIAALGEMWKGAAKGCRNVVMVTLGTGVGGGVVIDGKIVSGAFGAAGEIGHIRMSRTETEVCGCGKKGCLEQYAAAPGISRTARRIMGRDLSAKEVFDLAKAGDQDAGKVVDSMADYLGNALSMVSCAVDPEIFVIGGGVSNAGDFLIGKIERYYREDAFHASRDTRFAPAALGNEAGMYGAAKMILE